MKKKLLLIDGNYAMHRVGHVPALAELHTSTGIRTGIVYGFLNSIANVTERFPGYSPYVCFDGGLCQQRLMVFPEYKANRYDTRPREELTLEEQISYDEKQEYMEFFREQGKLLTEVLDLLGIPSLKVEGWEGDDLLALLSKGESKSVIVTDDKDMIQLVSETCRVYRPMASQKEAKPVIIDLDWFEKNGYTGPQDYMIQKSIKGDPSDNIPDSAPGVGWKKIQGFITIQEGLREIWASSEKGFEDPEAPAKVRKLCEDKQVKYASAYLKYQPEVFAINKKIIDLNNVRSFYTDEQVNAVYAEAERASQRAKEKRDFFGSIRKFKELEFNMNEESQRCLTPEMFTSF